jgi:hypothetical protein
VAWAGVCVILGATLMGARVTSICGGFWVVGSV